MTTEAIVGLLVAAIAALFGVMVAALRVAWNRLFNGNGLVTRAVEMHIDFVKNTDKSIKETAEFNKHIEENTSKVAECLRVQNKDLKELKRLQSETIEAIRMVESKV